MCCSKKSQFTRNMYQIAKSNRDGSKSTQAKRIRALEMFAKQLHLCGFRKLTHPRGMKQKHVIALNNYWKKNVSAHTRANYNSYLRWVLKKVNRQGVALKNEALGIKDYKKITNQNRAIELTSNQLKKISDERIKLQLKLQRAFGLRREESSKFKPSVADKGDHIALLKSWCKGGRARVVPILTQEQRALLEEAKKMVDTKNASMIPAHKSYKEHLNRYNGQTKKAGIHFKHGLRHAYAQDRYETLTTWDCPIKGGPSYKGMSKEQRKIDLETRKIISLELGHVRSQATVTYIGR